MIPPHSNARLPAGPLGNRPDFEVISKSNFEMALGHPRAAPFVDRRREVMGAREKRRKQTGDCSGCLDSHCRLSGNQARA